MFALCRADYRDFNFLLKNFKLEPYNNIFCPRGGAFRKNFPKFPWMDVSAIELYPLGSQKSNWRNQLRLKTETTETLTPNRAPWPSAPKILDYLPFFLQFKLKLAK